jgi:hypothetical protein
MPADTFKIAEQGVDEIFRLINEANDKDWIAVGACTKTMEGLTSGHAYTMLGALKLTDDTGKEWNLIKMRNPWGSEGYNGPWSDKDDRWTDTIKK